MVLQFDRDDEALCLQEILNQLDKNDDIEPDCRDYEALDQETGLDLIMNIGSPYQASAPQRRLSRASNGRFVILSEYKGFTENCIYGCLDCYHRFAVSPQRLSITKYRCPICNKLEKLDSMDFDVEEERFAEQGVDAPYLWAATCVRCGFRETVETIFRCRGCRKCRIQELYNGEYSVDNYAAYSMESVSVTHKKCGETYQTTMSQLLLGHFSCQRCKIEALYDEYMIDNMIAGYTESVSVTHTKCWKNFNAKISKILTGRLSCPYCEKDRR